MSAKLHIGLRAGSLGLAALAGAALVTPASAADYYAGKSVDLLIGAPPGGGYDIYGRVVARHIGRHIPGNPTIVPKNMPGAGSARAAGFISTIAPKDGTVIANIMPGAVIGPAARSEDGSAVRSDQGQVSRQRQQRRARLHFWQATPRSRRSTTRSSPTARPSAASPPTIPRATTATCTSRRRARITRWSPATRAQPIFRWRSSAARSTASAGSTGRA